MIQQDILESDTRLVVNLGLRRYTLFTEIERRFRKMFCNETKGKDMVRCFECCLCEINTFWRNVTHKD